MSNIGIAPGQIVPGRPQPARKLSVDVGDTATIGFRADGRLLVLHATAAGCEVRDYRGDKRPKVLASCPAARQVACEDVNGRLVFWADGVVVFDMPRGPERWNLYNSAGENPSE